MTFSFSSDHSIMLDFFDKNFQRKENSSDFQSFTKVSAWVDV